MRTVADFVPFVAFKARLDAPENIQHAVRETISLFMRESRAAINEVFIPVYATGCKGAVDVLLETPPCERLVQIESVSIPSSKCAIDRWTPEWKVLPAVPPEELYSQGYWVDDVLIPQSTLWLSRSVKTKVVHVKYSWAIGRDNCAVPDWLYEDYADVIAQGALAYLHDNPSDDGSATNFASRSGSQFMIAAMRLRERVRTKYNARTTKLASPWGRSG
jgi:hypothetical protein